MPRSSEKGKLVTAGGRAREGANPTPPVGSLNVARDIMDIGSEGACGIQGPPP